MAVTVHPLRAAARTSTPKETRRGLGGRPGLDSTSNTNGMIEAIGGLLEGLLARLRGNGRSLGQRFLRVHHKSLGAETR
eukprot:133619-Pyramimonas_sp.AAC.1